MNKLLAVLFALAFAGSARADLTVLEPNNLPLIIHECAGRTTTTDAQTAAALTGNTCGTIASDVYAHIVLVVGIEDAATVHSVDSMSVDGVTTDCREIADEDGTGIVNTAIWLCGPRNGLDSVDYNITASETVSNFAVKGFVVENLASEVASSATVDDDTASGELVLDLTATATDGVAFGVCNNSGAADATTWTGLDEDTDSQSAEADISFAYTGGTTTVPIVGGGARTVRCDWTGTNDASGAAAAFR